MSLTLTLAKKLTLSRDLSPDTRDREYKGRIKQLFSIVSLNLGKVILTSVLGGLFCLPIIALFIFVMPYLEAKALDGLKIIGDIGIGFGATDPQVALDAISSIYKIRQECVLYYLVPGALIAGIGFSGVFNVMRNMLWEADYKVFKHFFIGIARHWYKFALAFIILGLCLVSSFYPLLEIIKCKAIGTSVNGGIWVWMIISMILSIALIMYYLILLPMFVTYKYSKKPIENLGICIKNSGIIFLINPIQLFIMSIIFILPFALFLINAVSYIMAIVVLFIGIAFIAGMNIQYGQFMSDSFIAYLYNRQQDEDKKAQIKEAKEQKKKEKTNNKNRVSYKKKK